MIRVLNISGRRVGDIMTPRPEVEWIDADDDRGRCYRAFGTVGTSNSSSDAVRSTSR